jgi:hypothetical protein
MTTPTEAVLSFALEQASPKSRPSSMQLARTFKNIVKLTLARPLTKGKAPI